MNEKSTQFSLRAMLPRSLLGRSLLILIIPVVLIQFVTVSVFIDRHWEKVTGRLSHAVAGEIAVIADTIESGVNPDLMADVFTAINDHLALDSTYHRGAVLRQSEAPQTLELFQALFIRTLNEKLHEQLDRPYSLHVDFKGNKVTIEVQLDGGVLHVNLPERRLFSSSGLVFLLWVIGSSILLLAISVMFMRNQIRPIRKLAAAARRFGQGRDVPKFKPEGAREVRAAAQSFMDMHKRIKRQVEQRTAMLAGVSHDLRTPLTRLKLELAMLGDSQDIMDMKNDISEMEQMIDGYLDFVRGEGGEQSEITDLNALFTKTLAALDHHKGVTFHADIAANLTATLRPKAFERCVINILQNAAKHADDIWMSASVNEKDALILKIEDNGPGIPEAQYEEVFKPFYRIDEARSSADGGVGLGLPIAMDVVHRHGGKIWLSPSTHGGLAVNVKMPV